MLHIKRITVAKADMDDDDNGRPFLSLDDLFALLGGSVQDVLLSLVEAKNKGEAT
jgi:hypothetical protein